MGWMGRRWCSAVLNEHRPDEWCFLFASRADKFFFVLNDSQHCSQDTTAHLNSAEEFMAFLLPFIYKAFCRVSQFITNPFARLTFAIHES